jgi:hypothetical protein
VNAGLCGWFTGSLPVSWIGFGGRRAERKEDAAPKKVRNMLYPNILQKRGQFPRAASDMPRRHLWPPPPFNGDTLSFRELPHP